MTSSRHQTPNVGAGRKPKQAVWGATLSCLTPTRWRLTRAPQASRTKIHLDHGTYRLFCDVGNGANFDTLGFHEKQGMYVDFVVGGVGQVG